MWKRWELLVGLVVAFAAAGSAYGAWQLVDGVGNPRVPVVSGPADAIVVFAGEGRRFTLARQLAEAGVAPVLVLSANRLPAVAGGWCDERNLRFELLCIRSNVESTAEEAATFAALAREQGWVRLVAVTGDYHAQRASMLMSRCSGRGTAVSWALVDWPMVSWKLATEEVVETVVDWTLSRAC